MFGWLHHLFRREPSLHPLQQEARSLEAATRQQAAGKMASLEEESWVTQELLRLLVDNHSAVRQQARTSLETLSTVDTSELLAGLKHGRDEVAIACTELLSRLPDEEIVRQLLTTLKFAKRPVQNAARDALARCGSMAVPALQQAKENAHPWVREQLEIILANVE